MYYYVYNLQGDVTHIIDATGAIKGTYQYDAWGKIVNLSSLTAIAQVNPFRYRGYYYDNESGLYYLNSRYYNAEWGRFINADSYITTGQGVTGYNMFTYCGNSPINNVDPGGTCYYNANGVWCHDNWEYLGGYVRQPDPNIVAAQSAKKRDFAINTFGDLVETGTVSYIDDLLNQILKNPSLGLNSGLDDIYKALGFVSDNFGLLSILFDGIGIIWDYETYKNDPDSFSTSVNITIGFTAASVFVGGIVAMCSFAPPVAFGICAISTISLTICESYVRQKYLP